jgi:hypothetical protein
MTTMSRTNIFAMKFVRELQPKFANLTDNLADKYKGKLSIDCSNLLFPRVMSLKGKLPL